MIRTPLANEPDQFGDARVLAAQFVQPTPGIFMNMTDAGVIALGAVLIAAFMAGAITEHVDVTDKAGLMTFEALVAAGAVVVAIKILGPADLEERVREQFEQTKPDFMDTLNQNGRVAVYSPHPVTLSDNPRSTNFNAGVAQLSDFTTHVGLFHDKMQLVRRKHPTEGDQFLYVAYVGGMDVNKNRVDTPGHGGKGNYHDVHAKVTGAAALDFFGFFDDRYERDAARPDAPADMPAKVFDPGARSPTPASTSSRPRARRSDRPPAGRRSPGAHRRRDDQGDDRPRDPAGAPVHLRRGPVFHARLHVRAAAARRRRAVRAARDRVPH